MIQMGMREENRVQWSTGQSSKERKRLLTLLLRMHSAVEHYALSVGPEVVAVGADLRPPRKVNELQNEEAACQSPAAEQSGNCRRQELVRAEDGKKSHRAQTGISFGEKSPALFLILYSLGQSSPPDSDASPGTGS